MLMQSACLKGEVGAQDALPTLTPQPPAHTHPTASLPHSPHNPPLTLTPQFPRAFPAMLLDGGLMPPVTSSVTLALPLHCCCCSLNGKGLGTSYFDQAILSPLPLCHRV